MLNFRDEDTSRQFTEAVRASGIPISARTRTRGLGIDLDEEREQSQDEAVADILAQARTRRQAFIELRKEGLPVPSDLMADFAPMAQQEGVPPGDRRAAGHDRPDGRPAAHAARPGADP